MSHRVPRFVVASFLALTGLSALSALSAALVGCSGAEASGGGTAVEDVKGTPDFTGTYAPASNDDGFYAGSVSVVREGNALFLVLDGDRHALTKVKSGAYVFSEERDGECDDPGCSYTSKVSAVVYLKAKTPTVKLSFTREHPYPEYEGDLDVATTETEHWSKAASPEPQPQPDPEPKGKPALGTPSTDLAGKYAPVTDEDGYEISKLEVVKAGSAGLAIVVDGERYPLTRTKSGAYVFDSDEISGDCDNPGCSYRSGVSGVVYLKKEGATSYPAAKLTVREEHPHPESEGDIEGETKTTVRWAKR